MAELIYDTELYLQMKDRQDSKDRSTQDRGVDLHMTGKDREKYR